MPVSLYEVIWIFLIYAFLGWCSEVAFAALNSGKFVNRGFLNGPLCPVYGFGVLLVVVILTPLKKNILILFIGSVIVTSVIEFITGFLLEKLFHNQWWDYSAQPFNICGYVCLKFSIMWGLACTFVMDIVHPAVYKLIHKFPHIPGIIIMIILLTALFCDLGITVSTILKFNKHLKMMEEVAGKLHAISDGIGENIYENVATVVEKSEKFKEEHRETIEKLNEKKSEKQQELEELSKKYKELLEKRNIGFRRLTKAFPGMVSRDRNETLQKYKEHLNERIEKARSRKKKDGEESDGEENKI